MNHDYFPIKELWDPTLKTGDMVHLRSTTAPGSTMPMFQRAVMPSNVDEVRSFRYAYAPKNLDLKKKHWKAKVVSVIPDDTAINVDGQNGLLVPIRVRIFDIAPIDFRTEIVRGENAIGHFFLGRYFDGPECIGEKVVPVSREDVSYRSEKSGNVILIRNYRIGDQIVGRFKVSEFVPSVLDIAQQEHARRLPVLSRNKEAALDRFFVTFESMCLRAKQLRRI
ncbi:MAG: hypothetical protein HGB37_04175 [Candidatus Moranbacteria bacterium]|nr:hypothetical protein [Candidatus Moranbacteria bacterium]